jgi:hypothetical protein
MFYPHSCVSCRGVVPSIRYNTDAINYNDALWVFLGAGPGVGRSAEVWKFDLPTCKWELQTCKGDIPVARDGHSVTYVGEGKVLIFGGQGVPYLNDGKSEKVTDTMRIKTYFVREVMNNLYQFDCNNLTWTAVEIEGAAMPMGRRSHVACLATLSVNHMCYNKFEMSTIAAKPGTSHGHHHLKEGSHNGSSGSAPHAQTHSQGHGASTGAHHAGSVSHPATPATAHGHTSSHHGQQPPAAAAATADPEATEKVLLVFGGSGIEPSKYTEVIFNDLWAFSLLHGRWVRLNPDGAIPRALFDHKAEMVNNLMVVVGGISGIDSQMQQQQNRSSVTKTPHGHASNVNHNVSDVLLLDTATLTWSYQPLVDHYNKPTRLNLHGHSIVSEWVDNSNAGGVLFIVGGKEVVDIRAAVGQSAEIAARRRRHGPPRPTVWKLELFARGTVSPVEGIEGPLVPENRYGHICAAGLSNAIQLKEKVHAPPPPAASDELPEGATYSKNAAGARHPWSAGHRRGAFTPAPTRIDESLLYVFGGSSIDSAGFCDPIVYQLLRVHKFQDPVLLEAEKSGFSEESRRKSVTAAQSSLTAAALGIGGGPRASGLTMTSKTGITTLGDINENPFRRNDFDSPARRLSIWERKKLKVKLQKSMSTDQAAAAAASFNSNATGTSQTVTTASAMPTAQNPHGNESPGAMSMKNPTNWAELKTALSYPLHERKPGNDHGITEGLGAALGLGHPTSTGGHPPGARSPSKMLTRGTRQDSMGSIRPPGTKNSDTSTRGSNKSKEIVADEAPLNSTETALEHRNRMRCVSASLLPTMKQGVTLTSMRDNYLRSNTPTYLLETVDPYATAMQPNKSLNGYLKQITVTRSSSWLLEGSSAQLPH